MARSEKGGGAASRPPLLRTEKPPYTSLWSLAGSPPASGPVIVQVPVAVAGKERDPVEIDHTSRSGSASTLPMANTVYWLAPAVSAHCAASVMPTPVQGLDA